MTSYDINANLNFRRQELMLAIQREIYDPHGRAEFFFLCPVDCPTIIMHDATSNITRGPWISVILTSK